MPEKTFSLKLRVITLVNLVQFSTKEAVTMSKLMVIAVNVEEGIIDQSIVDNGNGTVSIDNKKPPRIVGLDSSDFDQAVEYLLKQGKAEIPNPHVPTKPFENGKPNYIAPILFTQNSPGCCWVIVNGWPFCIHT
jgi:hypothetical protein